MVPVLAEEELLVDNGKIVVKMIFLFRGEAWAFATKVTKHTGREIKGLKVLEVVNIGWEYWVLIGALV